MQMSQQQSQPQEGLDPETVQAIVDAISKIVFGITFALRVGSEIARIVVRAIRESIDRVYEEQSQQTRAPPSGNADIATTRRTHPPGETRPTDLQSPSSV